MVYVTHDQSEALTMSDRIAVFHQGRVQQLSSPRDMYERPASLFVAGFIGESNRLTGTNMLRSLCRRSRVVARRIYGLRKPVHPADQELTHQSILRSSACTRS